MWDLAAAGLAVSLQGNQVFSAARICNFLPVCGGQGAPIQTVEHSRGSVHLPQQEVMRASAGKQGQGDAEHC